MLSKNHVTNICAGLALCGSRSAVSNSITYVSSLLHCDRETVIYANYNNNIGYDDEMNVIKASVIRDLLEMRYINYLQGNKQTFFPNNDIDHMLLDLCTY